MVAGIALVITSIFVVSMIAMILAGLQADESNPLYWLASLFSGFLQSIEERYQETTEFKHSLGKEKTPTESSPEIQEEQSSVEPEKLDESISQNKIEERRSIKDSPIQMQEPEPNADTIKEEPEESSDFTILGGGSGSVKNPVQIFQDPIKIGGRFNEETQSWELTVLGDGLSPNDSLMVIISTYETESRTIASFEVQTNGNGDFNYSPSTLYDNLETGHYQVKILADDVKIFKELIHFDTFPEDVITWNLNPVSLVAGESATLQVFGQVNLDGPYFQNPIMIIENDSQTESISLIVKPDGKLYGTKKLTFNEAGTFTVKIFYDTLVRKGTLVISPML